ncbi:hypothetical protein AURDEDRAFT_187375 [Auricularia subglabra TFB-10046 SS5]|nr:hypothetical protein AURDEDRAFT_187375 [Auricularia subglabra TFB-10046 SS5]
MSLKFHRCSLTLWVMYLVGILTAFIGPEWDQFWELDVAYFHDTIRILDGYADPAHAGVVPFIQERVTRAEAILANPRHKRYLSGWLLRLELDFCLIEADHVVHVLICGSGR